MLMQSQGWTKLLFATLLAVISGNKCCMGVDVVLAGNSKNSGEQHKANIKYATDSQPGYQFYQSSQFQASNFDLERSPLLNFNSAANILISQSNPEAKPDTESLPQTPNPPSNPPPSNEPPQLEAQPREFPQSSPTIIEELLDKPAVNRTEQLERLRRILQLRQKPKPQTDNLRELELRVRQRPLPQQQPTSNANSLRELELRVRPRPVPQTKPPVAKFKPIGSLQANVGYFQTNNIFASEFFPREDGLIFYGLSLASAYFPLGAKTYINGSINGNLIRYIDQSRFNYNQINFNVGIYQQLSPRMYAELDFNNQQFFYAKSVGRFQAGDRFLDENSVRVSLGRRDPLNPRLNLDSFYEFSANFSEPNNRSRLINNFWLSLSYALQEPLQVGINYQLTLADFTQRQRNDNYHRLFGHVIYRVSNSSNLNVQSGFSFGDSTDRNINFDNWFLSVYYNLRIGEF
ncbi:hypothetical protein H6G80_14635 [Nostoc sp. FACHB-87]|uniref:hypothetical protein n=1 Tax=Nostocaceae TaxID=1162 RepID=UPI0016874DBD|nr:MULTISPECIES: hypothetical protein [Nostocaceae]MBD2455312.1 hypothetical protein [Nostoc sp. FACHB-87]MBD2476863.1 hypothetical protein [Anabaena sp. FACHB-83]